MNYKQHRNYGITTALTVSIGYYLFFTVVHYLQSGSIAFSFSLLIYCLILSVVALGGSLAPDLDTESIPSKWTARILVICWTVVLFSELIAEYTEYVLQWKPIAILTVIFLIAKSDKHRGITHALIWIPVLIVLSMFTWNHYYGAFAIGLAIHSYCDSISPWKFRNWF